MSGIQQRINPFSSPNTVDLSTGKSSSVPSVGGKMPGEDKAIDFKSILQSSNFDARMARVAKENGGDLVAETDEEFMDKMKQRTDPNANRKPSAEMDKDAFLKLFVTQLKNQDPLNPDDGAKMAANLAQFQGLEQMTNVNTNLEKLAKAQAQGRAVGLIDYVGKEVKLDGGKFKLTNGKITDTSFNLKEPVPSAILQIRDASGAVVAKKSMGNLNPGDHKIKWDGKGDDGKGINNGTYTFTIAATNLEGGEVPVPISSNVKITGVDLHSEGGGFFTELGKIDVGQVTSVGEQAYSNSSEAAAKAGAPPTKPSAQKVAPVNPNGGTKKQASAPVPADVMRQAQAAIAAQMGMAPPKAPAQTNGSAVIPEPADHTVPMPRSQKAPVQASDSADEGHNRS